MAQTEEAEQDKEGIMEKTGLLLVSVVMGSCDSAIIYPKKTRRAS